MNRLISFGKPLIFLSGFLLSNLTYAVCPATEYPLNLTPVPLELGSVRVGEFAEPLDGFFAQGAGQGCQ